MAKAEERHENIEIYDRLIALLPDQKRKGKASAYTSLNGHMFSFMDKNGELAIRFSEAEKKALMEKYGAKESIQYNSVMRGYIVVPDDLMSDFETLSGLFKASFEYIKGLKPKPTTSKKKTLLKKKETKT